MKPKEKEKEQLSLGLTTSCSKCGEEGKATELPYPLKKGHPAYPPGGVLCKSCFNGWWEGGIK